MGERNVAKKPIRSAEPRCSMGHAYFDWFCPSCKHFSTYEPNWRNIPKKCPECGQLLEKLTRKEAEEIY